MKENLSKLSFVLPGIKILKIETERKERKKGSRNSQRIAVIMKSKVEC